MEALKHARIPLRALILDGHSRAAVEYAQALGRHGAYVALSCEAEDCLGFRSRYVQERLRQPAPGARALEWLRSRHAQHAFDLVIPSTDVSLEWMRGVEDSDALRACAVLPRNAALDAALDRQAALERAAALGIPLPPSVLLRHGASDILPARYPVLLRATRRRVQVEGRIRRVESTVARNHEERERILERWLPYTPVQQQQCLPGHSYGIDLLFCRGRPMWHFAHESLHELPLSGGAGVYRRSIAPPPRLLAHAERLLESLQWHGVASVAFRGTQPEEARLVELKPGLSGSLALALDCGIDFPWGLALLALGRRLPAQPAYRVGYYTRHLLSDASWQLQNWSADRSDRLLLTGSRFAAALELMRPLLGRESWEHFDWKDPGVTTHMLATGTREVLERVKARLQRRRWRRRALRQHRPLLRSFTRRGRPERLLFICAGDLRGSLAAKMARQRVSGVEVRSAGLRPGSVPDKAPRLHKADVDRADLILCMDLETLMALDRLFPYASSRATLLGLLAHPRSLDIAQARPGAEKDAQAVEAVLESSLEALCEWLTTMPRPRRRGLRSSSDSSFRAR